MGRVEPEQNDVVISIETMDRVEPERNAARMSTDKLVALTMLGIFVSDILAALTRDALGW